MACRITRCCGCLGLRQGSLAIAITLLVLTTLELIGFIVVLSLGEDAFRDIVDPEQRMQVVTVVRIVSSIGLVLSLASLALHVTLVYGVRQERHRLILPWLIGIGIILGLSSLAQVLDFIDAAVVGEKWTIVVATLLLGLYGVAWYWFAVVLTHYQTLKAAHQQFSSHRLETEESPMA
ncbi:uncharacterized protein LOC119097626 [Pollicipes pollicipes]|uniref:uncharacterized protein LOC119097455 n=1 Tax=Pollicipes pollicipes TaxID=41117 RepID=UPI00188562C9|nr:uncharacterized protein LOC119097455 [Pollicipes pollicipes]XP_037076557.1 uncharacterized protein LOC119097626 [Pollicipes pollicipes]